ncbi:MAG TPA: Ger(x)C family spore germination protein, partial [Desulfobacteria bacterium]|nr:Ger(x)C family spore germination protein [Desulfobacteria bacterium]
PRGGRAVWLITAEGSTVFEALFKINPVSSKHLFFGHLSSIIIGEKAARGGVAEILDTFDRMPQLRRNVWVLVAPGQAKNVLLAQPQLQEIPSLAISSLFTHVGTTSVTYPSNLNSFFIQLTSRSTDPIVARIDTISQVDSLNNEQVKLIGEMGRKEIAIEGSAIFDKDKLVGWMNGIETRGVLWLQHKIKRGTLTIKNLRGNHKFLTFEILSSSRIIHTSMKDGRLVVNMKIYFDTNLVDQTSNADILSRDLFREQENVVGFYKAMNTQVKREMSLAIAKAQKHKVDVIGIGERFYIEHPQEFKKLKKDWPEIFAKAKFNIALDVKIRRVGLINRSFNAQQKESPFLKED